MKADNQHESSVPDRAVLDAFLADNPELEELSAKLSDFNVLRALRIEKAEIRHSNVLAWLLSPTESHGLRDAAIRRLLSNMLLGGEFDGVSAADIELMQFDDVEIRREWKHIDVLVIDYTNRLVVLIENKIHAGESKGQLVRYKTEVQKDFPDFKIIPVFLTLTGDGTSDEEADDYICYGYVQVLSVLETLVSQRSAQLSESVRMFLPQYLDTIRRLTMQDKGLEELCKKIYQRHREAIDLIVEYGKSSDCQSVAEDFLKEMPVEILASNSRWIWFLPRSWAVLVPENGSAWTHLKRRVSVGCFVQFLESEQRVRLICEVSRMDDPKLRMKAVTALRDANFTLSKQAFREDAKYSRFLSSSVTVDDMADTEEIAGAVRKLYQKLEPHIAEAEQVFKKVFGK